MRVHLHVSLVMLHSIMQVGSGQQLHFVTAETGVSVFHVMMTVGREGCDSQYLLCYIAVLREDTTDEIEDKTVSAGGILSSKLSLHLTGLTAPLPGAVMITTCLHLLTLLCNFLSKDSRRQGVY